MPETTNNDDLISSLSPNVHQFNSWKDSSNFTQIEAEKLFILTLYTIYSEFDYKLE